MQQPPVAPPLLQIPEAPTSYAAAQSRLADDTNANPHQNTKTSNQKDESSRSNPALEELNLQLYARGLTRGGLKLEGLNSKAQAHVVKVVSKLLSQRAEDFTQLEAMQTSHRVLSHDLDRLTDLHKELKKRVVCAEKERELARSQAVTLSQKLKREEQAHKLARDDFGRAQTALTLVRTQAQQDIKKREVQLERTLQHWQRLSSENARLLASGYRTGLTCLNPIESPEQAPRVDSLFDPNIRELDHQIISLQEECEAFRHVTLSTANQLIKLEAIAKQEPEPARIDAATFFKAHPLNSTQTSSSTSHPLTADTRLREVMGRLRSCIEADVTVKEETKRLKKDMLSEMVNSYEGERVERVRELMEQKMREMVAALENAKIEGRDLPTSSLIAQSSTPLTLGPNVEAVLAQEKEDLGKEKAAVDAEGKRVTETLVRLAQDRAMFEIERNAFLEEQRRFEMEKVMQEPPRAPSYPSRHSEESSPSKSRDPPRTPEKRNRAESQEGSSDEGGSSQDSQSSSSSSTHNLEVRLSPVKINSRPAVSSPLASSTANRHAAARIRSPLHRRRITKGPSTPLARFVSHKIVAEKLASAKKSRVAPTTERVGSADEEVATDTVKPVTRIIPVKTTRLTSLTAPTSSSALRSTTKANERLLLSQASTSRGALVKRVPSPPDSSKSGSSSLENAASQVRKDVKSTNSATSRTVSAGNAPRREVPSAIGTIRKLEVGQAVGIGPRNAAQTQTWR